VVSTRASQESFWKKASPKIQKEPVTWVRTPVGALQNF